MNRVSFLGGVGVSGFLAAAGILHLPFSAFAQSAAPGATVAPGVTVTDGGTRIIYEPAYFSQYNVVTAEDQLNRIPGVQDVIGGGGGGGGGGDRRGFGQSGDQVLINGKRLSGKSNDVGSALRHIQARQVRRIEVIRGSVAGLDVRSQGTVVNVVLEGTLVTGYGSWEGNWTFYSDKRTSPGGQLSYTGDIGSLNYLVSVELDPRIGRSARSELFYSPGGTLFERQQEVEKGFNYEGILTGNTSYTFANGDILNFNGRYAREDDDELEYSDRFDVVSGVELFDRHVFTFDEQKSNSWEIGGDYEHVYASGNVLTGLFVVNQAKFDQSSQFEVTPAGASTVLEEIQEEDQTASEKILRGTYLWKLAPGKSIEAGAELAINTLSQDVRLQENVGGVLVDVPIFLQDSKVSETRIESFTSYTWEPQADLLVEGAVDFEYSRIKQEGTDVDRARTFFYPRPRLDVRYDVTSLTQVRGRIERTVSQLDFSDFVSSFSNDDNRVDVINAGNPELVPEKAWVLEMAYERRLPDDMGVVTLIGQYEHTSDRIENIPVIVLDEDGNQELVSAPGNVGTGKGYQIQLIGSLRLDGLGLTGAVVEGSVEYEDSSVPDPFTGLKKEFNYRSNYEWSFAFRQDLPWRGLSYGFSMEQEGPSEYFDIDIRQREKERPDMEAFVEFQPVDGITMRLTVEEVFRARSSRERFQFIGSRADGVLERREERNEKPGREIGLSLRGVF